MCPKLTQQSTSSALCPFLGHIDTQIYTTHTSASPCRPFTLKEQTQQLVLFGSQGEAMKTKAVAMSWSAGGLLCLSSEAFIVPPVGNHVLGQSQHQLGRRPSPVTPAAGSSTATAAAPRLLLARTTMAFSRDYARSSDRGVVRRTRRASSSSFDAAAAGGESSRAAATPVGPGAGVIDLQFESLKAGGFKVFLLFFLLGVSGVM